MKRTNDPYRHAPSKSDITAWIIDAVRDHPGISHPALLNRMLAHKVLASQCAPLLVELICRGTITISSKGRATYAMKGG